MTTKTHRGPLNGVDTPTLFVTIDSVRTNPSLAAFQFRATNRWVSGTHNRTVIRGFYGAGQEDTSRTEDFRYDVDHPVVLVGTGNGPTAVEFLLHALAACLTAGLANIAAARGVELTEVESTVEGTPGRRAQAQVSRPARRSAGPSVTDRRRIPASGPDRRRESRGSR